MAHRAWKYATSTRLTMTILIVLGVLLLLNVVIPQEATLGAAAVDRVAREGSVLRFLLLNMRLSQLSTSPLFLLTLGAFFVNLALVLVDRSLTMLLRLRFNPPTEAQVRSMAGAPSALSFALPQDWSGERAVRVLARLGYRVSRPGPHSVWGLRNRTAVLGFPLFHFSFFVLLAGGGALYATRYVTTIVVAEGQTFQTTGGKIVRRPPRGIPPAQTLLLERVHARIEGGRPVQLGATLRRLGSGEEAAQESWINHPAEWGSLSVLVERAGVAPVLWLQDEKGFNLDKVAVLAVPGDAAPARTPLGDGSLTVEVTPIAVGPDFPQRDALPTASISLTVRRGSEVVYSGALRPGEFARVGTSSLKLEEVRYWVYLRVVDEYGGLFLVVGFLFAVAGLTWRLIWFRREVGVLWDDTRLVLVCRVEYFPLQFQEELGALHAFFLAERSGDEPRREMKSGP